MTSNTVRFLIVSDTHLGHAHHDTLRRDDSYDTFEEALSVARKHKCDAVLHAGDLFHNTRPSNHTMTRTTQILQDHHQKANAAQTCRLQIKSSDAHIERNAQNQACPVFCIHGNHDEPSGLHHTSPLHVLQEARLICYMDAPKPNNDVKRVISKNTPYMALRKRVVHPTLLTLSNDICVAVYGFGNVRDEVALRQALLTKHWSFAPPPPPSSTDFKHVYSVLMLHQNAPKLHNRSRCVDLTMLPSFFDFVIQGHEHEPLRTYTLNKQTRPVIFQPGSTISTSLAQSECKVKVVGLLNIGAKRALSRIQLTQSRPASYRKVILRDKDANRLLNLDNAKASAAWAKLVQTWLMEACRESVSLRRPLLRLVCDASKLEWHTWQRVRALYSQRAINSMASAYVANPTTMLQWKSPMSPAQEKQTSMSVAQIMSSSHHETDVHIERLISDTLRRDDIKFTFFNVDDLHGVFREHNREHGDTPTTKGALKKIQVALETLVEKTCEHAKS